MPNMLRTVVSLILGVAAGSVVNMAIVTLGPAVIAPPPGADMTSADGLRASMHLLEPRHFVAPFLAHAMGTLTGALVASVIAVSHRTIIAYAIGTLFLSGGIAASLMIPAPSWFIVLDLLGAYIPMAWLGLTLANQMKQRRER